MSEKCCKNCENKYKCEPRILFQYYDDNIKLSSWNNEFDFCSKFKQEQEPKKIEKLNNANINDCFSILDIVRKIDQIIDYINNLDMKK